MEVAVIKKRLALALGLVLALAGAASAQIATGNIYGVVRDQSGALMPGANATITSDVGTRSTVTGADGTFRFINLNRGDYTVTVSLSGFAAASRKVRVTTGENVELDFGLKVSGVAETVEVRRGDAARRHQEARHRDHDDHRGAAAGAERARPLGRPQERARRAPRPRQHRGQRERPAGRAPPARARRPTTRCGTSTASSSPTCPRPAPRRPTSTSTPSRRSASPPAAPTSTVQSGGIGINLVTKRGTNTFHGGAARFFAHDDLSSGNVPDELKNDPRLQGSDKADHIQQISDYGFDLGGPIVKDKLWFYGTYGKQDIRLTAAHPDRRQDPAALVQRQAQLAGRRRARWCRPSTSWAASRSSAARWATRSTRPTTSSGTRTTPTPTAACRAASGSSRSTTPSRRTSSCPRRPPTTTPASASSPRGGIGPDLHPRLRRGRGDRLVPARTRRSGRRRRVNLDGNYFFAGMGGNHELKFGFGYRDLKTTSSSRTTTATSSRAIINGRRRQGRLRVARRPHRVRRQVHQRLPRRRLHQGPLHASTSACAGTSRRPRTSRSEVAGQRRRSRTSSRRSTSPAATPT